MSARDLRASIAGLGLPLMLAGVALMLQPWGATLRFGFFATLAGIVLATVSTGRGDGGDDGGGCGGDGGDGGGGSA